MRIRLKRQFRYMDGTVTKTLEPGEHEVTSELAAKARKYGGAEIVVKKKEKAPEDKARGASPENKAGVGRSAKRGGGSRSKSDA